MPRKKTEPVVVQEESKVQEVTVSEKKELEIKPEIVSNKNAVSFVKPQVQSQPQVNKPVVVQKPQVQKPVYAQQVTTEPITGVLEIMQDNSGFVRPNFNPNGKDAYIASMQIRRYGLRAGDMIVGAAKKPKENEKYWAMTRIDKVNGMDLASALRRPDFKDLVPIYPEKQMKLETESDILSTRILDLFCPVGFGQRGMVKSPPKAGKTT